MAQCKIQSRTVNGRRRIRHGRYRSGGGFALAVLVLAGFLLAAWQQSQIRTLERRLESLAKTAAAAEAASRAVSSAPRAAREGDAVNPIRAVGGSPGPAAGSGSGVPACGAASWTWLHREEAQLTGEIRRLEGVAAENAALRTRLAAASVTLPPEFQSLGQARDRGRSIACVNNLKQLGLAARIYANDNQEWLPAGVVAMSNELGTPKVLACPADPAHTPAADWSGYSAANLSYEFLAPACSNVEPQRGVVFRCGVHGHVCRLWQRATAADEWGPAADPTRGQTVSRMSRMRSSIGVLGLAGVGAILVLVWQSGQVRRLEDRVRAFESVSLPKPAPAAAGVLVGTRHAQRG